MSYVTGSHHFKVGCFRMHGRLRTETFPNSSALSYTFLNGAPSQLTEYASPLVTVQVLRPELGLYAQDQWTIKRLTLNAGLRFEYLRVDVPASRQPAGLLIDARSFPEVDCVPCWKDLAPRFGAAYDLFGNGRTAIKASVGRYVQTQTNTIANANDPVITSANQVNRAWNDLNRDFVPNCDLRSTVANGECGPMSNANFGKPNITTRYDPDVLVGWGKRPYGWQASATVEHELRSGVAVTVGYFRAWYGNFLTTRNQSVTTADFDPYCFTVPVDPRLPGGGGNQICGLYDITPTKFGQVNNFVTFSSNYGEQFERYNGIDVLLNARLLNGGLLAGGFNIGNSISTASYDTTGSSRACFVVDNPQKLYHCDIPVPYQTRFKIHGSYPLPWNLQVSANFQALPGATITATYPVPTALIAPSLGRNLAGGARTASVELIRNLSMFEGRINQLDARLGKKFQIGKVRVLGSVDVYNLLNTSAVVNINRTYGPAWLQPTQVLDARLIKFGLQLEL